MLPQPLFQTLLGDKMTVDVDRFVARFDHHDPEFSRDGVPWEIYAALRDRCPVAYTDASGGFYVISRYNDVARIAKDPAMFSNRWAVTIPGFPPDQPAPVESLNIPLGMDPPEFNEWRRMLNPYFSPQKAESRVAEMRALVTELIDEFVESGRADLYPALLSPFPARLTCRILGLPEEDWHFFADPVHDSLQSRKVQTGEGASYGAGHNPAMQDAVMRMVEIARERRDSGGEDVLSFLGRAEIYGRPLREFEMAGICTVLLGGGVDTTTNAIGVALVEISRRPELRRQLVDDPSLIPAVIEEVLRMWAPFQGLARRVMGEVEIGGCPLHEGDRVMLLWASANRDRAEFDRPDEVVVDRAANRHLAFGLGPHRCIGAHFARAEMRVALEEVIRRLLDFAVVEDGLELQEDCGLIYGYRRVPVVFTPGRREG
jgi:cytochrome P450